jgi:hypothetical protein
VALSFTPPKTQLWLAHQIEDLNMRTPLTLYALILSALLAVGCERDGPVENAGEEVDDAISDTGNAIEDACEDVKDAVDAEDRDC